MVVELDDRIARFNFTKPPNAEFGPLSELTLSQALASAFILNSTPRYRFQQIDDPIVSTLVNPGQCHLNSPRHDREMFAIGGWVFTGKAATGDAFRSIGLFRFSSSIDDKTSVSWIISGRNPAKRTPISMTVSGTTMPR